MQHPELGRHILDRVIETVSHVALVEAYPKQDGRNMVMVLGPDKKAQVKRVPRTRSDTASTGEHPVVDEAAVAAPAAAPPVAG